MAGKRGLIGAGAVALIAVAGAVPLGAGGQSPSGDLTIYSSLPRQGASREPTVGIERGAALALAERGGKAGGRTIAFKRLDDSRSSTGAADEQKGQRNARTAANDPTTIAFIGAYNSGISKVEIPILNKAGIAQVSPSNTYVGLTVDGPGAEPGEPDKYYPTGKRTYARILPHDVVQGAALATAARDAKCASIEIFDSKTRYSYGLAATARSAAERLGLTVRASRSYDPQAPNYRSLARKVKARCVVQTGEIESNGSQLLRDVGSARRKAKLFAGDGMCLNDTGRELPKSIAARLRCTIAALAPGAYGPKGREFFARYKSRYNERNPDVYAIYGYESMALLLDSIERASAPPPSGGPYQDPNARGEVTREKVVAALLATRDRDSVLGRYGIDANGDTTLTDYGLYRVARKRLRFDRVVRAQGLGR